MIHSFDDVPMLWRVRAVLGMIRMQQHCAEPDECFREWIDEADRSDQAHVDFAFAAWAEVRTWNAFELDEQTAILRYVLWELGERVNPRDT